ncbi:MAG: 2'-5' RNA ligase family protein [Ardenticatenaceae bacterium]|nr:2'-5' RNA ligase family protein [Ardenticatenaceae bacterium]
MTRKPKPRQRSGDYCIFIGAFPDGSLAEQIQAIRQRYDLKTAVITPPHVTLAGTYWRSGPATAENEADLINRLQEMTGKIRAFNLELGSIRTFGRRVVYLGVQPTDDLLTVRATLLRLAGRDKHRIFAPHLTLAMRLNQPDTARMIAELKASEWENGRFTAPIHELRLMQRGPADPAWRTIYQLPLKS